MLSFTQRQAIFVLFYAATISFLGLESYLIWSMIHDGVSTGKGVGALLSSGGLAGCGLFFQRLLEANFLKREVLPMSRLHDLASERTRMLEGALQQGQSAFDVKRGLITATLQFAEETLRGWIEGNHLEFCVFVDAEQPLLFSYFDSNKNTSARSMSKRVENSNYYVEEGYEVIKVLNNPTSQLRVLSDTTDEGAGYVFTSAAQKKQLKSTLLLSLDMNQPCALVITSNEKGAIPESDPRFASFVRYLGEMIRFDLFDGGFLQNIRTTKPELFG